MGYSSGNFPRSLITYDSLNHNINFQKFNQYGIGAPAHKLRKSYFTE